MSAFALGYLSRHRCGDVGEFFGTPRIVLHKMARRMSRARKPANATLIHLDAGRRLTGERYEWPVGVRVRS